MSNEPRPAHILYIDDDPGIGRLVQRALRARGYTVDVETDGHAGLSRIMNGGIDLVALDHHMPGHTGLEILPRIRELPDAPPVVYVTGYEDSRVAVAALKAGAIDYVWKDVQGHFRELLGEAIATALEKDRLRREHEAAEQAVREARDRAELLLIEVNHRVANSLAIVAAMARMQSTAVKDPAAREGPAGNAGARRSHRGHPPFALHVRRRARRRHAGLSRQTRRRTGRGHESIGTRTPDPAGGRAHPGSHRQGGVGRGDRDRARDQRL